MKACLNRITEVTYGDFLSSQEFWCVAPKFSSNNLYLQLCSAARTQTFDQYIKSVLQQTNVDKKYSCAFKNRNTNECCL